MGSGEERCSGKGVPAPGYAAANIRLAGLILSGWTVRRLYALYDQLGCLGAVARAARVEGLCSKRHRFHTGREQDGGPVSRGQIYSLLRNPIYLGKIRHKTQVWDGQHDAILEADLWARVQEKLQAASGRPRRQVADPARAAGQVPAPLTGKLRDETGDRLTSTDILAGRQPVDFTPARILRRPVPLDWDAQAKLYGIGAYS